METTRDLMKLDKQALSKRAGDMRAELLGLKFSLSVSGMEKPHRIKVLKKNIARIMTVYNLKPGK